jgi:hypothetical protein
MRNIVVGVALSRSRCGRQPLYTDAGLDYDHRLQLLRR